MTGHALAAITESRADENPLGWTVFGYRCACGVGGVAQSRVVTDPVVLRERARANHGLHALRALTNARPTGRVTSGTETDRER